ncbi:hypothetical protein NHH73_24330 [Oxalobacteraceae bacterium OTU3CINTB1]|nr:hypothetical protein NHH73_24330 [Oxalobacteraceae bacterium OTU3CINTB1]
MAIGSILVLVLRYIGVELVLYKVVKRDLHDIAAAMTGETIDVKTARAFPKKQAAIKGE